MDEQYKRPEFKVSYIKKELTSNFCDKNARSYSLFGAPIAALSWSNQTQNKNRYKHTGMETIEDFGLGYVDNGARWRGNAYASSGFLSIDPLAENYYHLSPYLFCAGNPIKYIDIDGRKIVVAGKNREAVYQDLALIYATPLGRGIIDALHRSKEVYKINGDALFADDSGYNNRFSFLFGNRISYYQGEKNRNGTTFLSHEMLGHELFHAYQDETNQLKNRFNAEKGAVMFENYLREIYGTGFQRLTYSGNKLFRVNEPTSYPTNGERRDINSVRSYTNITMNDTSNSNSNDDTHRQDNTRVNHMQILIDRVFEYMDRNGLQAVRVTF
ncbi:MAG: hypothetical protein FWH23_03655 [Bacteroidales bacterium]|nr:hypothetical protein [Bacteroidales bacterium]